jgi:hypothetical protein
MGSYLLFYYSYLSLLDDPPSPSPPLFIIFHLTLVCESVRALSVGEAVLFPLCTKKINPATGYLRS